MGGNVIILEEAAYVSLTTFLDIIAPLMVVDSVCMIAISTMGKAKSNFFTRLITSGDFYAYSFSYMCGNCMKKGRTGDSCIHNIDYIPHWASEGQLDKIKNLVGEGEKERFGREALGIVTEEIGNNCFPASKITAIYSQPRVSLDFACRFVFVVVDPCAGSDIADKRESDFAVITLGGEHSVILGMEAWDVVQSEDYETKLIEHIKKIRALPRCRDARIILDVEAGTGLEAGNIIGLVQKNFRNVVPILDFYRKPGTKTTEPVKMEMMEMTREMIERKDVYIHEDFVTSDPNPETILCKWRDQMLDYTREVKVSASINQASHVILSGKGKNGGTPDDLSVTYQRAVRCSKRFLHDAKYANDRR